MKKKPTLEELEHILEHEGDKSIQILPNGELRIKEKSTKMKLWKKLLIGLLLVIVGIVVGGLIVWYGLGGLFDIDSWIKV